jgi:hypothetical protein
MTRKLCELCGDGWATEIDNPPHQFKYDHNGTQVLLPTRFRVYECDTCYGEYAEQDESATKEKAIEQYLNSLGNTNDS